MPPFRPDKAIVGSTVASNEAMELRPTVLIVDDNDTTRRLLREQLEKSCFTILEACCGEECLRRCRTQLADLVLLDYHMPGMNGEETYHALRAANCRASVIFITAQPRAQEIVQRLQEHDPRVRLLAKPFGREELVAAAQDYLACS